MKFEIGGKVKYIDDNSFPSLNGKEGIIIDIDKHLGITYLVVDFCLDNGKKYTGSLFYKNFKKVKMTRAELENGRKQLYSGD